MSCYDEVLKVANRGAGPIVFKSGCFDIFHVGHLRMLEFAEQFGRVFVGVGSDETVRQLKGPDRPVFPQDIRVEVLNALLCVDHAFVLTERCVGRIDHRELLEELRPKYWILPPTDKALSEKRAIAEDLGIEILLKDEYEGCSSTSLQPFLR